MTEQIETPLCGELTDADAHGCRWIDGEPTPLRPGMFCGATPAAPGSSWCAEHRKLRLGVSARRRSAPARGRTRQLRRGLGRLVP